MKLNRANKVLIEKGLTQAELARKLGTNRSYVSGVLRGANPSSRMRYRIAKALGCAMKDLWPKEQS